MSAVRTAIVACLVLAACDGNPFGPTTGTTVTDGGSSVVPAEVANDMTAFSYDGTTLKIDMKGVSSSGKLATYTRTPALDVPSDTGNPGYEAYVYQDTRETRSYLAYVARNERGNLLAVSSADGGQFNEHNYGGRFVQLTAYTRPETADAPESGEFTYIGSYVGIFAPGEYTDASSSQPPGFRPAEPWQVRGVAKIVGDFARGSVEGGIENRQLFTQDGARVNAIVLNDGNPSTEDQQIDTSTLRALVLRETTVSSGGRFLGDVEYLGAPGNVQGNFAGAFGGNGATDVAGVLWVHPVEGKPEIWESGTFNLPRCDLPGSSPVCLR